MANGREIRDVSELIDATTPRAGEPTVYVIEREGQALPAITITPADHDGRGQIGVGAKLIPLYENLGAWDSAKLSIVLPYQLTMAQLNGLADLVIQRSTEASDDCLGGCDGAHGYSRLEKKGDYALHSKSKSIIWHLCNYRKVH